MSVNREDAATWLEGYSILGKVTGAEGNVMAAIAAQLRADEAALAAAEAETARMAANFGVEPLGDVLGNLTQISNGIVGLRDQIAAAEAERDRRADMTPADVDEILKSHTWEQERADRAEAERDAAITDLGDYMLYPHPKEIIEDFERVSAEAAALREEVAELRKRLSVFITPEQQRENLRHNLGSNAPTDRLQSRLAAAVRALEVQKEYEDYTRSKVVEGVCPDDFPEFGRKAAELQARARDLRTAALAADADGEGRETAHGRIAQRTEHRGSNATVAGSNPAAPTNSRSPEERQPG